MRKLATIVRVGEINPIEGADRIEVASIEDKAWKCVVGKNEFEAGQTALYFEVDSFLPKQEPFMFLEGRCNKKMDGVEGYRLRTVKLRGVYSQGLLMPLNKFPAQVIGTNDVGDDVTEALGVKLYEPPIPAQLAGDVKGMFPSIISKTDQERLQNLIEYFDTMKGVKFECSLKLDGSSATTYFNNSEEEPFGVCSRNLNLKETEGNTFWKVSNRLKLKERLSEFYKQFNRNIALQSELCGEGIQSNRSKLKGHNFFMFDIFDIDKYSYIENTERYDILEKLNEMDGEEIVHVPIISKGMDVFNEFKNFDEVHDWVSSQKGYNGTTPEGVVFKSCEPVNGQIISFKVINNKYLAKHGE